ncbi:unnamed protein product [Prorocentrum cordatum]|uniref:Uncharacterized protein n=1 Tax=Prorocentrum cordatum TaxID=2364126 RepID=A0ABN9WEY3_9DINO|nr:unnamed protein product [Polarella glacialis]
MAVDVPEVLPKSDAARRMVETKQKKDLSSTPLADLRKQAAGLSGSPEGAAVGNKGNIANLLFNAHVKETTENDDLNRAMFTHLCDNMMATGKLEVGAAISTNQFKAATSQAGPEEAADGDDVVHVQLDGIDYQLLFYGMTMSGNLARDLTDAVQDSWIAHDIEGVPDKSVAARVKTETNEPEGKDESPGVVRVAQPAVPPSDLGPASAGAEVAAAGSEAASAGDKGTEVVAAVAEPCGPREPGCLEDVGSTSLRFAPSGRIRSCSWISRVRARAE